MMADLFGNESVAQSGFSFPESLTERFTGGHTCALTHPGHGPTKRGLGYGFASSAIRWKSFGGEGKRLPLLLQNPKSQTTSPATTPVNFLFSEDIMVKKKQITVYDCICDNPECRHAWRAYRLPKCCSRCKVSWWNAGGPRKRGRKPKAEGLNLKPRSEGISTETAKRVRKIPLPDIGPMPPARPAHATGCHCLMCTQSA